VITLSPTAIIDNGAKIGALVKIYQQPIIANFIQEIIVKLQSRYLMCNSINVKKNLLLIQTKSSTIKM